MTFARFIAYDPASPAQTAAKVTIMAKAIMRYLSTLRGRKVFIPGTDGDGGSPGNVMSWKNLLASSLRGTVMGTACVRPSTSRLMMKLDCDGLVAMLF